MVGHVIERTGVYAASPDQIDTQAIRDVSWSMESAECLLWALGYVERLPPVRHPGGCRGLEAVAFGWHRRVDSKRNFARTLISISKARDVAQLWHWRSRTRQLQEQWMPRSTSKRFDANRRCSNGSREGDRLYGLFEAIDGDFPAFRRSYAQLTADEWSEVNSIAMERHKALNWLCGYAPANKWEDTPTTRSHSLSCAQVAPVGL